MIKLGIPSGAIKFAMTSVVPAVPGHDPQRAEGVIGSRLEVTASVRDE